MKKLSWRTTLIGLGIGLLTTGKYLGFLPDELYTLLLGIATGILGVTAKDAPINPTKDNN